MRTIGLLLTLLALAPQAPADQKTVVPEGTTITSAQVTGFDVNRLSPGLRQAIRDLAGTPLDQQRLDALAARIEAERPRYVAAVRAVMESDGQARVLFVMGELSAPDGDNNVNARYIVEQADITGVPDAEQTQALRDDLRALVGQRLDSSDAERLQAHIERELPGYEVSRRIQRGSDVGRIRLVYEARRKEPPPWLRFDALRANGLFNSEHGWGSYLDLPIGDRTFRFTPIVALDDADTLVEEYSGYGLRFEARQLGTRRFGASFEWTRFDPDWEGATLSALAIRPGIPGPYDTRSTVTPLLKFAFNPALSVTAGVSISELDPYAPGNGTQMANAAVASIDYDQRWKSGVDAEHHVDAGFSMRAGARELDSDLVYNRYLGVGSYRYDLGRHHLNVSGMAGAITNHAPLFERFTLGDSNTLRGWDKYDIAPAGGDRMFHSSIEYRYTGLALFLDFGSVWDTGAEPSIRVSTGFGFHAGPAFLVVGFPLNTENLTTIVTLGLRIRGAGLRW